MIQPHAFRRTGLFDWKLRQAGFGPGLGRGFGGRFQPPPQGLRHALPILPVSRLPHPPPALLDHRRHGLRQAYVVEGQLAGVGADDHVAVAQRAAQQIGAHADREHHVQRRLLPAVVQADHLLQPHRPPVGDQVVVVAPVQPAPKSIAQAEGQQQTAGPAQDRPNGHTPHGQPGSDPREHHRHAQALQQDVEVLAGGGQHGFALGQPAGPQAERQPSAVGRKAQGPERPRPGLEGGLQGPPLPHQHAAGLGRHQVGVEGALMHQFQVAEQVPRNQRAQRLRLGLGLTLNQDQQGAGRLALPGDDVSGFDLLQGQPGGHLLKRRGGHLVQKRHALQHGKRQRIGHARDCSMRPPQAPQPHPCAILPPLSPEQGGPEGRLGEAQNGRPTAKRPAAQHRRAGPHRS